MHRNFLLNCTTSYYKYRALHEQIIANAELALYAIETRWHVSVGGVLCAVRA